MIDQYLTEYDENISGESFRDPMGMQVIWSAIGQRIFGWHITSRANDLRNYTQALFQHYVVREIENDDTIEIPSFARHYYGSKYDPRFKASLIIFLENLFVYTAVLKQFDCSGVLGSQSAGHKLQLFNKDPVILIHEDAGILVRQISLGLNGSYKTPLMQLEILDRNYQYPNNDIWTKIISLFEQWEDALALKDMLLKILKKVFDDCQFSGRSRLDPESLAPYRELAEEAASSSAGFRYSEINYYEEALGGLYKAVLIDPAYSRYHFGDFWKEQLGLDGGAAGAIFESLVEVTDPYEINNTDLLWAALSYAPSEDEKAKIEDILAIEPLLAFMVSLFYLLCCRENKSFRDIAEYLGRKDAGENELKEHWEKIDWNQVQKVADKLESGSTAAWRLKKLCESQHQWNLMSCLRHIVSYHREIMEERGLYPWVTADESGKLHHTGRSFARNNWKFTPWVHDYYLSSVKNIYHGVNGDKR